MMNTDQSSQEISNAQPERSEERIQLCRDLTYSEKAKVRLNITGNKDAYHYNFEESRSVRMSVKPPLSVQDSQNPQERPKPVPLVHIINCFNGGSLNEFGAGLQGLFSVSFNTYKVTFRTESMARNVINKFQNETTGKGTGPEEIFQFQVSDFKDPVRTLTFFPIPVEISEVQMKELIEDVLNLGTIENLSWGRHRDTMWRNGFLHARIRTKRDDLPDRVYINTRSVTILKENDKLHRPCPLCNMRTHDIKLCPAFHHFETFAIDKQKMLQERADAEIARKLQAAEKIKEIQQILSTEKSNAGHEFSIFDTNLDDDDDVENPTSTPASSSDDDLMANKIEDALNLSSSINLQTSNLLEHSAISQITGSGKEDDNEDGKKQEDEEKKKDEETLQDEEAIAEKDFLFDTANITMKADTHSSDGVVPATLPNVMPGIQVTKKGEEAYKVPAQTKVFKAKVTKDKSASSKMKTPPMTRSEKRKKSSPPAEFIGKSLKTVASFLGAGTSKNKDDNLPP